MFLLRSVRPGRDGVSVTARLPLVLLCALALGGGLLSPLRASRTSEPRQLDALQDTVEWDHLVRLWQRLLDYSQQHLARSDQIRALPNDLEIAEADLESLTRSQPGRPALLSKEIADELAAVYRGRCQYLQDHLLQSPGSAIRLSALEAAADAAQWVVEMQLSVLRKARQGPLVPEQPPDPKLAEAARANLEYEFTFLHHHRDFQAGLLRRRAELVKREQDGKAVDWPAFEVECERKRSALLRAYRQRRLPTVRVVRATMPYLAALTQADASPAAATPGM